MDGTIVMMETILKKREDDPSALLDRRTIARRAAEVAKPIFFATLIIITAYLPLFAFDRVERKPCRSSHLTGWSASCLPRWHLP